MLFQTKSIQVKITTVLALFAISMTSVAQTTEFCVKDKTEHKMENETRFGVFKVERIEDYRDFTYHQFTFLLNTEQVKKASNILSQHASTPQGEFIKLGTLPCDEIRAPSDIEDLLSEGLYYEAITFEGSIELWSNGIELYLNFPAIVDVESSSKSHKIYVTKDCVGDMINALNK